MGNCSGKMPTKGQLNKKTSQTDLIPIKVVLCGNAAVGKTSITLRYKENSFTKVNEPTMVGAYHEKKIKSKNGKNIQLNIWDTAGDERFQSVMPLYYRKAEMALLVFDITNVMSFSKIDYWLDELDEKVNKDGMMICIIGNKKDLEEERQVSSDQGMLKAHERNCLYHECSALSGEGVEELFEKVVQSYLNKKL